ncbi:MAG: hypothetical protein HXY40_04275 [Chloroflexi bacterium]|nr:hypothetical protein [Chloroflexota bacterium]
MPVSVSWDNDAHSIIHFQMSAPWTWDEYRSADEQAQRLMDAATHKVDIILDFSGGMHLPSSDLKYVRRAGQLTHPQQGLVVVLGVNAFLRALGTALETFFPGAAKNRRMAASKEEAYRMIAEEQVARGSSQSR